MTRRATTRVGLLVPCCVLSLLCFCEGRWGSSALAVGPSASAIEAPARGMPEDALERRAPEKAYALLEALKQRHGEPLPGYVGGRLFQNREHRLPQGRYKEYDVNRRIPGRSRDAERVVIEQNTGKAYYTDDHYRTFLPLN